MCLAYHELATEELRNKCIQSHKSSILPVCCYLKDLIGVDITNTSAAFIKVRVDQKDMDNLNNQDRYQNEQRMDQRRKPVCSAV